MDVRGNNHSDPTPPLTPFDFWKYDANSKGSQVYLQRTAITDRKQVVPNPGAEIYEFTGATAGNPLYAKRSNGRRR